jgi:hypothetical protein
MIIGCRVRFPPSPRPARRMLPTKPQRAPVLSGRIRSDLPKGSQGRIGVCSDDLEVHLRCPAVPWISRGQPELCDKMRKAGLIAPDNPGMRISDRDSCRWTLESETSPIQRSGRARLPLLGSRPPRSPPPRHCGRWPRQCCRSRSWVRRDQLARHRCRSPLPRPR